MYCQKVKRAQLQKLELHKICFELLYIVQIQLSTVKYIQAHGAWGSVVVKALRY
jgi:hypothetical protein